MSKDMKVAQLAGISLFSTVDRGRLHRIAGCCTEVRLSTGQVLCRQGGRAREVLVVEKGFAAVQVDGRTVGELTPGDCFGGLAALAAQQCSATVRALTPMRVLALTRAELCAVLEIAPELAGRLLRTAERRPVAAVPEPRAPRIGALMRRA